jgi:hypothetical protein
VRLLGAAFGPLLPRPACDDLSAVGEADAASAAHPLLIPPELSWPSRTPACCGVPPPLAVSPLVFTCRIGRYGTVSVSTHGSSS